MISVFLTVLPLALGAAVSPSITAIVLALMSNRDHPRLRALAFWIGAILSLLVWAILVSSFMWSLVQGAAKDIYRYERGIFIVLGVLLIVMGIRRGFWTNEAGVPKRFDLTALGSGPYNRQVLFGAFMQGRNATSVLLFIAAQQHIDAAPLNIAEQVALTLVVIFIATASIWLPMFVPERTTERIDTRTEPIREWLASNARWIEAVAAVGFGIYLIVKAVWFP